MTGGLSEDQDQELVQFRETRELLEAELIALKLRDAGIDVQVIDQSFRQEPLPDVRAFSRVHVMIPKQRLSEAERILADSVALPEDAEAAPEGEGE